MATIRIEAERTLGKIKPLHGTVNGPVVNHDGSCSTASGFREIGVPYVRLHDSSFFANYGGEHTVDISGIFPDFDKDPLDPESYDFEMTDGYIERTLAVGSRIFYRLGQRIEVKPKKYHVHPPKDFQKWATVCEHIIRHYNEGWNNGFHHGIEYFEIWNEPDNRPACWTGTTEQFDDFFETAAKRLKSEFPHLKIGGPAFAEWSVDNGELCRFVKEMHRRGVPLDFLSWHTYSRKIDDYTRRASIVRQTLDEGGYPHAESILDEWNYLINWKDGMAQTYHKIIAMEGAALVAANQATMQSAPVDMMMYYDARPCGFNGLFRAFTYDKYKAFYSMLFFSVLYKLGRQIACQTDDGDVYAVAATDGDDCAAVLTYYTYDASAADKRVSILLCAPKDEKFDLLLLDETHDAEFIGEGTANTPIDLVLRPNSVVLLRTKSEKGRISE